MYDLHSLHGQFSGWYFFISLLKVSNAVFFLNLLGTICQIFRPRSKIHSVPHKKNTSQMC